MVLLLMVLSLRKNITRSNTNAQMLLKEEWIKRSTVSLTMLFHH